MKPSKRGIVAPTFEVVSNLHDFARTHPIPIQVTLGQLERIYPKEQNLFYNALGESLMNMVQVDPTLDGTTLVLMRQQQTAESFMRITLEIVGVKDLA